MGAAISVTVFACNTRSHTRLPLRRCWPSKGVRDRGSPRKLSAAPVPGGLPEAGAVGKAGGWAAPPGTERSRILPPLNAPLSRRLISISLMDEWSRLMAAQERETARGLCGRLPTPAPQPAGCAVPSLRRPGARQAPHVWGLPGASVPSEEGLHFPCPPAEVSLAPQVGATRGSLPLLPGLARLPSPGTCCLLQPPPPQTPAPYRAWAYPGDTQAPPLPCPHECANVDPWGRPLQPNPVHREPPLADPAPGLAAPTLRACMANRPPATATTIRSQDRAESCAHWPWATAQVWRTGRAPASICARRSVSFSLTQTLGPGLSRPHFTVGKTRLA